MAQVLGSQTGLSTPLQTNLADLSTRVARSIVRSAEPYYKSDSAGCRYLAIRLGLPVHVQTNLADLSAREAVDQLQPPSLAATASNPGSASHHGRHLSDVDAQDFDLVSQVFAGSSEAAETVSGSAACMHTLVQDKLSHETRTTETDSDQCFDGGRLGAASV